MRNNIHLFSRLHHFLAALTVAFFFMCVTESKAQCPVVSTLAGCGDVTPNPVFAGLGEFCYNGSQSIQVTTPVIADSIHICFGDGSDTTLLGPSSNFNVFHVYSVTPTDSCPASPPSNLFIEIISYRTCGGGLVSRRWLSTPVTVKYKPRPRFSVTDTICINDQAVITTPFSPPSGCLNAYAGSPGSYYWNYGDGSPFDYVNSTTSNTYQSPGPHTYTTPGIKTITLRANNECDSATYQRNVVVLAITGVAYSPSPICRFDTITTTIQSNYNGGFHIASVNAITPPYIDGVVVKNDTIHPRIVFSQAGTYVIRYQADLISPNHLCDFYDTVQVFRAPYLTQTPISDTCFSGVLSIPYNLHFDTLTGVQQADTFAVYRNGVLIPPVWTGNAIPPGSLTITQPGSYSIQATATNQCGRVSLNNAFNVCVPIDSVQLTANTCTNDTITARVFSGNTGGNSVSVSPNTGVTIFGGNTNTPRFVFTVPGSYTITFRVCGCQLQKTINVTAGANLSFSGTLPSGCSVGQPSLVIGNIITTTNNQQSNQVRFDSAGVQIFSANTTGALPNTPIAINGADTFRLRVVSFSSCDTVTLDTSFVITAPVNVTLPPDTQLCLQQNINLPVPAPTVTVRLDGVLITNYTYYIDSNRVYRFIYTPQCGTADTFIVTGIGQKAYANPAGGCFNATLITLSATQNQNVVFSGQHVIQPSTFDATGLPQGQYPFYTAYTHSGTGCIYRDTALVSIGSATPTGFTVTNACDSLPVTFTNTSAGGVSASVLFGDGTAAQTGNSIPHTYAAPGTYTVRVTFTDANSCVVTDSATSTVYARPNARFTLADSICYSAASTATLTTPTPGASYSWTLNGNSVNAAPVITNNNTLATMVTQVVAVTATTNQLCPAATETHTINLIPQTVADFGLSYNSNCNPVTVATANNSHGAYLSYQWFLNGVLFSSDSVPAPYALTADVTDSVYQVMLVAYSPSCAESDTLTDTVVVHPINFLPVLNLLTFTACEEVGQVYATDGVLSTATINYNWGDGSIENNQLPGDTLSHIYAAPGTYPVSIVVTNNCQTGTDTQYVTIRQRPHVSQTHSGGACTGNSVNFTGSVQPAIAGSFYWNFGDNTIDSLSTNPAHVYTSAGTFSGFVTATDTSSCPADSALFTITVNATPTAVMATPDTIVCQHQPLTVALTAFTPNTQYTWLWDSAGTINTIITSNSALAFPTQTAGNFNLSVIAANLLDSACRSVSGSIQIVVKPQPMLLPAYSPATCFGTPVQFSVTAQPITPSAYSWWFGDGAAGSTLAAPSHLYSAPGTYNGFVVADDSTVCQPDTAFFSINVVAVPDAQLQSTDTIICRYNPLLLSVTQPAAGTTYNWVSVLNGDTATNVTFNGQLNFSTAVPGLYKAYVQAANSLVPGCNSTSAAINILVREKPLLTVAHSFENCSTTPVDFTTAMQPFVAINYVWNFGDGNTTPGNSAVQHLYAGGGNYQGWVVAADTSLCPSDTAYFNVLVNQNPSALFTHGDTTVCQYQPLILHVDTAYGDATYPWSVYNQVDTLPVITLDGSLAINTTYPGVFDVFVTPFNNNLPTCNSVSSTIRVTVFPAPVADFTVKLIDNHNYQMINTSRNDTAWLWQFSNNQQSYEQSPFIKFEEPDRYYVLLTTYNQFCTDTQLREILVVPEMHIFVPNVFTPNADGNNDFFEVFKRPQDLDYLTVQVYDRTGQLVYDNNGYINFQWDGTYKGVALPPQVFVYVIEVSAWGSEKKEKYKGSITLLR